MDEIGIAESFNIMAVFRGRDVAAASCLHDPPHIELGCDIEKVNGHLKAGDGIPFFDQFTDMRNYYEDWTGPLITHEVLHHLIWLISRGFSGKFDNVDENHEISGFALLSK